MLLVSSRLGLVTATLYIGHPFSRSYRVILPSSLKRVISRSLVFSTNLPVSVSGTGILYITHYKKFSWKHDINHFKHRSVVYSSLSSKHILYYASQRLKI